jgi:hypothetical protein
MFHLDGPRPALVAGAAAAYAGVSQNARRRFPA